MRTLGMIPLVAFLSFPLLGIEEMLAIRFIHTFSKYWVELNPTFKPFEHLAARNLVILWGEQE